MLHIPRRSFKIASSEIIISVETDQKERAKHEQEFFF